MENIPFSCLFGRQGGDMMRDFGIILLELFNFSCYPQAADLADPETHNSKAVIDLAASCLLPNPSLRPSMQYVAQALRSLRQARRLLSLPASKLATSSESGSSATKQRCHSFG
jgi:hypothetical protein